MINKRLQKYRDLQKFHAIITDLLHSNRTWKILCEPNRFSRTYRKDSPHIQILEFVEE